MNDLFAGLDDTKLGHLAYLVHSPAYEEFFEPLLRGMERDMLESIIDPSMERKVSKPDDYLRGGIMVIRAILAAPEFAIEESRNKAIEESRIQKDEDFYNERAAAGSVGPLPYQVMTDDNQTEEGWPAGGYDPATDY